MPSGGIFGGEVAVMNLDGWTWEDATLRANAGIEFNFPRHRRDGGRGGGGGGGGRGGAPSNTPFDQLKKQRDDRLDQIAQLFERARAYAKAGPDKTKDWVLDALVPVVERRLPLVVNVVARSPTFATRSRSRIA